MQRLGLTLCRMLWCSALCAPLVAMAAWGAEPLLENDPSISGPSPSLSPTPTPSSQRQPFQLRVTESYQLPAEMYGQWSVTATLLNTNMPGQHAQVVNDIWNLVQQGDVVTLSNPNTGATATITVDAVKGNTATFTHKAVIKSGREYLVERPTVTVRGNSMRGTTTHQYISMRQGRVMGVYTAVFAIDAVKLGDESPRFGTAPADFVIEDIQPEKTQPSTKGQTPSLRNVHSSMFGR
ncbi:MAG: hypothetical protein U0003_05810 [Vampirovibrionales bacterium]